MFLDYYHLRENPFGVTPDPHYLYLGPSHREALASLYCGVEAGRGFMALIAEAGMGKTTLLSQLMDRLRNSTSLAFLFQTQCDSREFLRYLLADMGLEIGERDTVHLHQQLNEALIRIARAGRRFVLVVDEAQNLDRSVLETIRLLSDFETQSSKLIQIILSGQPQLAEKLASPALVQLRQRIAIVSRLEPFSTQETAEYIQHRLRVAGHEKGRLFSSGAERLIADWSKGIPRNINNLCFNALSLGCALRRSTIDREIVLEAARDLGADMFGSAGYSAQGSAPTALAPQPRKALQAARPSGIGYGLVGSAALGALFTFACLFLFPSTRGDYRAWFPRAWNAGREAIEQIQLTFPAPARAVSTALSGSNAALLNRLSSVPAVPPEESVNVVAVKPGETLSQICGVRFGRFDNDLVQQVRALNPQITDANHIEAGQTILLPTRIPRSTGTSTNRLSKIESIKSTRN